MVTLRIVLRQEVALGAHIGKLTSRSNNLLNPMKQIALSDAKDLSKLLRQAEKETIVLTRRGKPAGVLVGFTSEDDWFGLQART